MALHEARGNTSPDYATALVVNPSSATALYGRGIVKMRTGDVKGGTQDADDQAHDEVIVQELPDES